MNDAGIAAWDAKYIYNLWRPVTAIRNCSDWSNGNFTTCDATWGSLIATPPHPDYVAGHPAFSGAAATILAAYFGTDNISFASTSNYYCNDATSSQSDANNLLVSCTIGTGANAVVYYVSNAADCARIVNGINTNGSPLICPITETFDSFSAGSQGADGSTYSRVVGGIHTSFAVENALALGDGIGQNVAAAAGLETVPEPSSMALCGVGLLWLTRPRRRQSAAV